jgi:hypothetical protein
MPRRSTSAARAKASARFASATGSTGLRSVTSVAGEPEPQPGRDAHRHQRRGHRRGHEHDSELSDAPGSARPSACVRREWRAG